MQMPQHDCPGDCGRRVNYGKYSCRDCWDRLPHNLRTLILTTYGNRNHPNDAQAGATAHRAAMLEARRWFITNKPIRDGAR